MRRNLTAVLAADVAGYSRLMGEDAEGTLKALRKLRTEVLGPAVSGHRGKIVKNMGDGWLVIFGSVVDAVECAMKVQDRAVDNDRIKLRVGIHLGDIVHEEDDVFGDGVNIAARLQEIGGLGAVVISDAVYGSLDGILRPSFDDAGECELKNIARPVRVWTRGGEIAGTGFARQKVEGFPRLSVVPVETSDERAEIQELAEALTNDLVTYFSATKWLNAGASIEPAPEAYVLRCVLRASGDRLRLESMLAEPGGGQLWTEKHNGDLSGSFDWQDAVAADLVSQVFGRVRDREIHLLDRTRDDQKTAEQWVLKSSLRPVSDGKHWAAGLADIEHAIALKPDWSWPYAVGLTLISAAVTNGVGDQIAPFLVREDEWLAKIEALEPPSSPTRAATAFHRYTRSGSRDAVREEMAALQRYLPFDPDISLYGGWLFLFAGDPAPALACFSKVDTIARHLPAYHMISTSGRAGALLMLGRYEEAAETAEKAVALNPAYPVTQRFLAAACAYLGKTKRAKEALEALERLVPGDTISGIVQRARYSDTEGTRRYMEGLRLAGLPE